MAIFLVAAPVARADEDVIGTVLEVEGTANVIANGVKSPITVNMPVHTGDLLTTGSESRLYIMLLDSTELTLSENGNLSVDDYVYDEANNSDNHAAYSIIKGAFLYVSGLVAKKENPEVTVKTGVGSIGIRGTRFWGGEMDGKFGVLVGDGEVEFDSGAGPVRIRKGEGTSVKARGEKPEPINTWPREKIDRAVKTVALKNPEVVGQRIKVEKAERQEFMRQQHKNFQDKKLEMIRKEIEAANPNMPTKPTTEELQKLRRERAANPSAPLDGKLMELRNGTPLDKPAPNAATQALRPQQQGLTAGQVRAMPLQQGEARKIEPLKAGANPIKAAPLDRANTTGIPAAPKQLPPIPVPAAPLSEKPSEAVQERQEIMKNEASSSHTISKETMEAIQRTMDMVEGKTDVIEKPAVAPAVKNLPAKNEAVQKLPIAKLPAGAPKAE
ncbi:MAG: FecR domain-containing protein [Alphaproteobacteria bacterium]|nr:FecR domain-containing protein [Alphaproteobacteria bacterium]